MDIQQFELLAAAALADGEVNAEEEALLERLALLCGLTREDAAEVLSQTPARAEPPWPDDLRPRLAIYESVFAVLSADHILNASERGFLERVARRLGVPGSDAVTCQARVILQRVPSPLYVLIVTGVLLGGAQLVFTGLEEAFGGEPLGLRAVGAMLGGMVFAWLAGRSLSETYRYGFREAEGNPGYREQRAMRPSTIARSFGWLTLILTALTAYELLGGEALSLIDLSSLGQEDEVLWRWVPRRLAPGAYTLHIIDSAALAAVQGLFQRRVAALIRLARDDS